MAVKWPGKVQRHLHLATKWLLQDSLRSALQGYQQVPTDGLERHTLAGEPEKISSDFLFELYREGFLGVDTGSLVCLCSLMEAIWGPASQSFFYRSLHQKLS